MYGDGVEVSGWVGEFDFLFFSSVFLVWLGGEVEVGRSVK